jgi:hypothetical protein
MSDEGNARQLEYWSKLKNSILNFQYIEESLRMYIVSANGAGLRTSGENHPAWSYKDLQKDSLDRLLDKFERCNANRQLLEKLARLKDHRDYCRQQAYLSEAAGGRDAAGLSRELEAIDRIWQISTECLNNLFAEWKKIRLAEKENLGPAPHSRVGPFSPARGAAGLRP